MPDPAILTKQERRWIATDLSNFCEKLVKDNSNINQLALAGWGGSGLSLAGLIFVPGAQIPFAVAIFGLGGYSVYKGYISWQKQREIDKLTTNIGTVIWSLKNSQ